MVAEKTELAKAGTERRPPTAVSFPAMLAGLRKRFASLPGAQQRWLVICAIFLVVLCTISLWFIQRPDWRVLFSGLDSRDVQQVSQELAGAGIPFRITPGSGDIEVASDTVDKARMEVAAKGMPQTGRLGFELFDKPNWVGSEFDEHVNYQRALEGELEHTIESLEIVQSARVHLVVPEPSLFTSEAKPAKASVVLKLRKSSIDQAQIESIRSLVAGAVDGLSPEGVALIDADGRANLRSPSKNAAEGDIEQAMEAKLVSLLEPLAGRDNVRAVVNITFNRGTVEKTDEIYDPTQVATLNMQRSEQTNNQNNKPSGVPGTASNTPAASPNGAVQGSSAATPGTPPLLQKDSMSVYPQSGGQLQTIKEESGSYANTKHLVHSEDGPGRIDRISTAIVVNDRMLMEGEGKSRHAVWKARSAEEMHRMEGLVQASVGFDSKRGDQVVVQNMGFIANAPGAQPALVQRMTEQLRDLLQAQPGLLRTLTLGVCGVLLVLLVLRPMARQLMTTLKESASAVSSQRFSNSLEDGAGGEIKTLHESSPANAQLTDGLAWKRGRTSSQVIFDEVSEHIRREPLQSTRLLENWISTPEEPEAD